jgi:DNA polymerase-3 subunit beta
VIQIVERMEACLYQKKEREMRITVDRAELASAFGWAAKALPRRPVVPVQGGMKLSVEGHMLTLSVFDYEQSLRVRVNGDDAGSGEILVDGCDLKKIVATLPKGKHVTVGLSANENALTIASRGTTWTLAALPGDEYPALPELPPLYGVTDGEAFASSATRVSRATSRDGKRPALGCVQFTTHPEALSLAATDRYRLAADRLSWIPAALGAESLTVLVPWYALDLFAAKGHSGKAAIHLSAELAGFADDTRTLTIRTCSGEFPSWQALLRAKSPLVLTASAPALAAIIGGVGPMSGRGEPIVLAYAQGTLTVQAVRGGHAGAATEALPATAEGSGQFEVRFFPPYLASMLEGFDGDVHIGLGGDLADSPKVAVIRAAGDDTFTALVIPTRIPKGLCG